MAFEQKSFLVFREGKSPLNCIKICSVSVFPSLDATCTGSSCTSRNINRSFFSWDFSIFFPFHKEKYWKVSPIYKIWRCNLQLLQSLSRRADSPLKAQPRQLHMHSVWRTTLGDVQQASLCLFSMMGGFSIGNYVVSASLPLEVRDWQDFHSLWDTSTTSQSGKLLIFFYKGKTKNIMLVQFVKHGDALDYLTFIVLLANLNEFPFRGRQKCNHTKANEVLISYV